MVRIERPLTDMVPDCSKWFGRKLEAYGNQLVYGENTDGFFYTYHDRLFSYPYKCIDQIEKIIKNLKADRSSRKELSITWNPEIDLGSDQSVPCMILIDFKLRDNKLNATIYMRSWDTGSAAPANLYAFAKLLEYVAGEVKAVVGFLTVICSAAHIYQEDIGDARRIAGMIA